MDNNKVNLVKGTHDLVGPEIHKFKFITDCFYEVCSRFNFQPIQTPIIEHQDLFVRAVGEYTDIVSKEMYAFTDKNDKTICLRPEATSGIARHVAENYQTGLVKLCTHGPMFRRERPQKGRYRQFHQINIEAIGEKHAYIDFEIILVAKLLLDSLSINTSDYKLIINSLGSTEDQLNYSKKLKNYFESYKSQLSETSLERLEKNPLRILDSKNEEDQKIIINAPLMKEVLSEKSKQYFEQIKELLNENSIDFIEENNLVRGLDYYTHTAFEFQTTQDKRQNAILAGGRYDKLINMISSKDIPGIGWAAGVERLMDLVTLPNETEKSQLKILIAVQDESYLKNKLIMNQFYNSSYTHEIKINNNIKKLFTYADKNSFNYIVLIGEEEQLNQKITFKNLMNKEQKSINQSEFNLTNEIR